MLIRLISLSLIFYLWLPMPMAIALICRTDGEQKICLVSIKRSAKYFWEYRAVLEINGKKQTPEKFDCRIEFNKTDGDRPTEKEIRRAFVCRLTSKL
jgi:hypothetical protein